MIVVKFLPPEEGEDSVVSVELRDDDGTLRQTARVAEDSSEWALTVSVVTA